MRKNNNKPTRWLPMTRTTSPENGEPIHDFLPTPNWPIDILMARELFTNSIWEPACGDGRMSRRLASWGYKVKSTEKYDRGFGITGTDFLTCNKVYAPNVVTNPPFKFAVPFINHCDELGISKFAFLLRTMFIESKTRRSLFERLPPKKIIHIADRVMFDGSEEPGGGFSVSWFIWDKSYKGPTTFEWAYHSTL